MSADINVFHNSGTEHLDIAWY